MSYDWFIFLVTIGGRRVLSRLKYRGNPKGTCVSQTGKGESKKQPPPAPLLPRFRLTNFQMLRQVYVEL